MIARPILLVAALAAIASVSGCDTISDMTGWMSGNSAAPFEVTQDQPYLEVRFHGVALKDAKIDEASNEIALRLNGDADGAMFAQVQRRVPDWILGTHTDNDTANIVAREAASFSAQPVSNGFVLTIKKRDGTATTPDNSDVASKDDPSDTPLDGLQREDMDTAFGVAETPPPEVPPRGSL